MSIKIVFFNIIVLSMLLYSCQVGNDSFQNSTLIEILLSNNTRYTLFLTIKNITSQFEATAKLNTYINIGNSSDTGDYTGIFVLFSFGKERLDDSSNMFLCIAYQNKTGKCQDYISDKNSILTIVNNRENKVLSYDFTLTNNMLIDSFFNYEYTWKLNRSMKMDDYLNGDSPIFWAFGIINSTGFEVRKTKLLHNSGVIFIENGCNFHSFTLLLFFLIVSLNLLN